MEAAAAAMAADFVAFVEDPGLLEGIDYNNRTKAAYPSIEGVGMIAADTQHFNSVVRAEDFGMALMLWKGEEVSESTFHTGSISDTCV